MNIKNGTHTTTTQANESIIREVIREAMSSALAVGGEIQSGTITISFERLADGTYRARGVTKEAPAAT
jgi:DNA helicase IV